MTDHLLDQAARYVSGAMTARERDEFDLVLEFHHELREIVADLADVGSALTLNAPLPAAVNLSDALKTRIVSATRSLPQRAKADPMVMAGPDGLVQWINPAFTDLCGYALDELRGKKLGPILQGAQTDPEAAARMRQAVQAHRPCRETILNYHKSGAPYWVEVAITPICDGADRALWLVARERKMAAPAR
jgi:PAS domain S-box-containing protein